MEVRVEESSPIRRRMTVKIPANRLEEMISGRLKRLAKKVKLPGFRPGKVPMKIMEAQYGPQAMSEAQGELIQQSYVEAVDQEGLKPAGMPKIEALKVDRGEPLEYVAEFDIYPKISTLDLKGKTVERPQCDITDADIDHTLETMQKQQQTWSVVEREAADGDQVTIDFKGTLDGEVFQGGEAQDFPLVLGSKTMVEGFEDGLLGAKAGEQRTLKVKFAKDYQAQLLAGKKAEFCVDVKTVSEAELPEINEEFAKKLGVEDGSLEKLREDVKKNLEQEKEARLRNLLRTRVLNQLLESNKIEVPESLIIEEKGRMQEANARQQQASGRADMPDIDDTTLTGFATRRVTLGLILSEIVSANGIKADADLVRRRVEELAQGYESPDEIVRWYYEKPGRLQELESVVVEEKVVETVLEGATIEDKAIEFEKLLKVKD